jgi:two-component system, LytTR family, response regulator
MTTTPWPVVIADDEPLARRGVRQLLSRFPDFEIVGESRNGPTTLATIETLKPDLLFLDIQMPGLDGFEVLRRRRRAPLPAIVFLTAWDQFALRAFEAAAVDYLVKPVTEARFAAAMKRVTTFLRGRSAATTPTAREPFFAVTTSYGITAIPLGEVDWIEACDNYVRLWTATTSHLHREAMADIEARAVAHGFIRTHRGALVRLDAIRAFDRRNDHSADVRLASGTRIPVARRRRAAVVAALRNGSTAPGR